MTRRDWSLLLTLSLLWGGSFVFVELALRGLPPLTIVIGRVGVAALILGLLLWGKRFSAKNRAPPCCRGGPGARRW